MCTVTNLLIGKVNCDQGGTMPEYDRERIARLFDSKTKTDIHAGLHESIPEKASRIAFEQLELKSEDMLLDVGTGTGDTAIAAAGICRQVIGIDISEKSLEKARQKAFQKKVDNVTFAYGAFEEPCAGLDLTSYGITKILAVYSLHHLPDPLKRKSLQILVNLLQRPGRLVIGDLMVFEDPQEYCEEFDEVYYDGGDFDFPSRVEYLVTCLEQVGAHVHVEKVHPLVGVLRADFV